MAAAAQIRRLDGCTRDSCSGQGRLCGCSGGGCVDCLFDFPELTLREHRRPEPNMMDTWSQRDLTAPRRAHSLVIHLLAPPNLTMSLPAQLSSAAAAPSPQGGHSILAAVSSHCVVSSTCLHFQSSSLTFNQTLQPCIAHPYSKKIYLSPLNPITIGPSRSHHVAV